MTANISYFKERVDWEGAAIEKLTCKKDVPVRERIFALCRVAVTDRDLICRIWSFDCFPEDSFSLLWTIKNGEKELKARIFKNGEYSLTADSEDKKDELTCGLISGEDLQGEYWGGVFSIPLKLVNEFMGRDIMASESEIPMKMTKEGKYISEYEGNFQILR